MFESLTDKMSAALRNLRGLGKLSEENMAEALKEVRSALLSADVHFKVAREFVETVKEKAIGQKVIYSVSPGQQIVKIIHDELAALLGEGAAAPLSEQRPLFQLMGQAADAIGATLNRSCLIVPLKSVSGIYFHAAEHFCNCRLCNREKCPGRREQQKPGSRC